MVSDTVRYQDNYDKGYGKMSLECVTSGIQQDLKFSGTSLWYGIMMNGMW